MIRADAKSFVPLRVPGYCPFSDHPDLYIQNENARRAAVIAKMEISPIDRLTYPELNRYTAPPNARTRIINITELKLPDVPASAVDLEIIYQNILKEDMHSRRRLQAFHHFWGE
jgi:hypothetical protein